MACHPNKSTSFKFPLAHFHAYNSLWFLILQEPSHCFPLVSLSLHSHCFKLVYLLIATYTTSLTPLEFSYRSWFSFLLLNVQQIIFSLICHSVLAKLSTMPTMFVIPMPTPGSPNVPHFKGKHITDCLYCLEAHTMATGIIFNNLPAYILCYCHHHHIHNIIDSSTHWMWHDWTATWAYLVNLYGSRQLSVILPLHIWSRYWWLLAM
jgi:hypothetical protein